MKDQIITSRQAKFWLRIFAMVGVVGLLGSGTTSAYAAVLDLRQLGSQSFDSSSVGLFQQYNNQNSGTGILDSFVRINDSNDPLTQGFNTSKDPMSQVNTSPQFTRDFQLSFLNNQVVNISGTDYYQFVLDINEPNDSPKNLLVVQSLLISTSSQQINFTGLTDTQKLGLITDPNSPIVSQRYDLGGDSILLDGNLKQGSGTPDMLAFIPVSLFAGASQNDWVYLYSAFGWTTNTSGWPDGSQQDGNFEEWATIQGGVVIPEPSTYIFGFLLFGALVWVERSRIAAIAQKLAGQY